MRQVDYAAYLGIKMNLLAHFILDLCESNLAQLEGGRVLASSMHLCTNLPLQVEKRDLLQR
jgi:hypothetical protein